MKMKQATNQKDKNRQIYAKYKYKYGRPRQRSKRPGGKVQGQSRVSRSSVIWSEKILRLVIWQIEACDRPLIEASHEIVAGLPRRPPRSHDQMQWKNKLTQEQKEDTTCTSSTYLYL